MKGSPRVPKIKSLTREQLEVLRLLDEGFSTHQVATRLGMTRQGVDSRLQRTFNVLGVDTRAAALNEARRRGLIPNIEAQKSEALTAILDRHGKKLRKLGFDRIVRVALRSSRAGGAR